MSPPLREQAVNALSIKPTFHKIFLFVIEESLSIEGVGGGLVRVRDNVKKLDEKTENPLSHKHHTS